MDERSPPPYRSLLTDVAVGLLAWVVLLVGWEVSWARRTEIRDAEAAVVARVVRDMTLLRASLDFALAAGAEEQVDRELTARGADPSLQALLLVDETGRVIGARLRHHVGRPMAEVLGAEPPEDMMVAARSRQIGSTRVTADGEVVATWPVILGAEPGRLRADRVGVVVATYDLERARAEVGARVVRRALELGFGSAIATLALLVFGHVYIGKRVRVLVRATERIAAGEFGSPARVGGRDELALIGAAFDTMAERLGETLRRVAESEARFRTLVQAAPVGILRTDAEGRITASNAAWRALAGYGEDDWRATLHPDDREAVSREWEEASRTGRTARAECRVVRGDGAVAHVHVEGVPEGTDREEGAGFMLTVVDLTERLRAEEERARLEARLQQARKLEALGTLASGVAHDFNNVLAAVEGHADALAEAVEGQPAAERHVHRVLEAAERGRRMIREILEFGRPGVRVPREVGVASLVDEVARMLRPALPDNVTLRVSVAPDLPPIVADADQLHRALVNLGTNAWQAMRPRGGTLEIGARAVALDPDQAVRVPGLRPGPALLLWVRDEGSGMDAATLARVFEPFFSTKPAGEGTGLGLAVVHGIVTAHGGGIAVDTELGRGTTFSVYLPTAGGEARSQHLRTAPGGVVRAPHVLYVDDDESLLELAERAFHRAGFRVSTHARPEVALAAFREGAADVDLVVTDWHMSGMSGEELAAAVLRLRPELPVVMVSGRVTPEDAARLRGLGLRAVVEKPRSIADLASLCLDLLRGPTGG